MAGRKPLYHTAEEMPVTCSLRVPRGLYDETQQYLGEHRLSLTEFLLDAIRLRLDTPADPRDIKVSDNGNTIVLQELRAMVDAAVEAALARERTLAPPRDMPTLAPAPAASMSELSHDDNNTVIQEKDTAPSDAPEALDAQIDQHISRLEHRIHEMQHYDNNTVIHEPLPEAALTPPDAIQYYDNNTVLQEETVQVSDTEGTPCPTAVHKETAQVSDVGGTSGQTAGQTAIPPFDASKRYLGALCPRGHAWPGTEQSLRNRKGSYCLACNKETQRVKRQQVGA